MMGGNSRGEVGKCSDFSTSIKRIISAIKETFQHGGNEGTFDAHSPDSLIDLELSPDIFLLGNAFRLWFEQFSRHHVDSEGPKDTPYSVPPPFSNSHFFGTAVFTCDLPWIRPMLCVRYQAFYA